MSRIVVSLVCVAATVLSTPAIFAQSTNDRVQRRNGVDSGSITAITPLGVTISKGGVTSKIPAEEIKSIRFDGEPAELNAARMQFIRGRFDISAEQLKKIARDNIVRPEVSQELDFLIVATRGNLALAGQIDKKQMAAEVGKFLAAQKTSFHVPAAIELQGDLLRAAAEYDLARKKYETLAKAPNPYFKARSALLVGKTLQEQGKHAEALPHFEATLTTIGPGPTTADIKREATFGRAISLSATGKLVEGTNIVKQIIKQTAIDETGVLAQGYNTLGECYLAGGDTQAARDAFLHVDLLLSVDATEHAQSLYRLTSLWKDLRQPTRAQDAQQRLGDEYPLSRWSHR